MMASALTLTWTKRHVRAVWHFKSQRTLLLVQLEILAPSLESVGLDRGRLFSLPTLPTYFLEMFRLSLSTLLQE